jgi:2-polyprenyl-6-methoxyphenol hydroxylase-like FAD-dependent oxidoreductase
MTQHIETDVLIVGAGPSGLALAAELLRRGITSMVVDRQAAGANTSRAAVIHARTMEVLEPLGVTPALLSAGIQVPNFRVRDRDRELISLDFSGLPTAYPYALMCPQDQTERILLERFVALGGRVERPCELTRWVLTAEGVEAELLLNGTQTRQVRARWLVGCDGMHSRVREQAGIPFLGAQYEESFLLADVHMDWPLSRKEVSLFLASAGLLVVAPLPGERYRIVATTPSDQDAPQQPSAACVQALLDERGPIAKRGRVQDVVWSSRFRVHHRVAESPRKGRVLLCGDAAHVHSPAGGQGMNTGIQDAISLGASTHGQARATRWHNRWSP